MSPSVKRIAKTVIAIAVAIGLVVAFRSAMDQWHDQQTAALAEVEALNRAITNADSEEQLHTLLEQRQRAAAAVPKLTRLRWSLVGASAFFYAIGLIPGGLVLHQAVRTFGYRVSMASCLAAQIVGHLGKYIPGKAMVVVIRAGRLTQSGVPIVAGSLSVFVETLMMMAVGAALSGCLVLFLPVPRWIAWLALVGGLAAMVPTVPPLMRRLVRKISNRTRQTDAGANLAEPASAPSIPLTTSAPVLRQEWRLFALAWFWQLIGWIMIGASFACLVCSVPGGTLWEQPITTIYMASVASIALAMVAGFASLLPGGAGVRELTLAVVLAPVAGSSQALLAAILARVVFISVELAAAVAVSAVSQLGPSIPPDQDRNLA